MGNSSSHQSQNYIQIDPTQYAKLVDQHQKYAVYQNFRSQQFEKYKIKRNDTSEDFKKKYYYRIFNRSNELVEVLYAEEKKISFSCSQEEDFQVVTQRIKFRLKDLQQINFQNALTITRTALKGFKQIFQHDGILLVTDQMIGVNCYQQVKVWMNSNFALNYIQQVPIALKNLQRSPQHLQDILVNNIVDLINSRARQTKQWRQLMSMKSSFKNISFLSAIQICSRLTSKYHLKDINMVFNIHNSISLNDRVQIGGINSNMNTNFAFGEHNNNNNIGSKTHFNTDRQLNHAKNLKSRDQISNKQIQNDSRNQGFQGFEVQNLYNARMSSFGREINDRRFGLQQEVAYQGNYQRYGQKQNGFSHHIKPKMIETPILTKRQVNYPSNINHVNHMNHVKMDYNAQNKKNQNLANNFKANDRAIHQSLGRNIIMPRQNYYNERSSSPINLIEQTNYNYLPIQQKNNNQHPQQSQQFNTFNLHQNRKYYQQSQSISKSKSNKIPQNYQNYPLFDYKNKNINFDHHADDRVHSHQQFYIDRDNQLAQIHNHNHKHNQATQLQQLEPHLKKTTSDNSENIQNVIRNENVQKAKGMRTPHHMLMSAPVHGVPSSQSINSNQVRGSHSHSHADTIRNQSHAYPIRNTNQNSNYNYSSNTGIQFNVPNTFARNDNGPTRSNSNLAGNSHQQQQNRDTQIGSYNYKNDGNFSNSSNFIGNRIGANSSNRQIGVLPHRADVDFARPNLGQSSLYNKKPILVNFNGKISETPVSLIVPHEQIHKNTKLPLNVEDQNNWGEPIKIQKNNNPIPNQMNLNQDQSIRPTQQDIQINVNYAPSELSFSEDEALQRLLMDQPSTTIKINSNNINYDIPTSLDGFPSNNIGNKSIHSIKVAEQVNKNANENLYEEANQNFKNLSQTIKIQNRSGNSWKGQQRQSKSNVTRFEEASTQRQLANRMIYSKRYGHDDIKQHSTASKQLKSIKTKTDINKIQ